MKFILNVPNDYGSGDDYMSALIAAYGDDLTQDRLSVSHLHAGNKSKIYAPIAAAAADAGLKRVRETDYGAEWSGSLGEYQLCRAILPDWAKKYASRAE